MKHVTVAYFASLREAAKTSQEDVETASETLAGLFHELGDRYGFKLRPENVKASLNLRWAGLDEGFSDGDSVVFIPPVAGG